jgi:serine/threonine protein kinase
LVIPEDLSPQAADLLRKLLEKEHKKRLGAGQHGVDNIKKHPFFAVSFSTYPLQNNVYKSSSESSGMYCCDLNWMSTDVSEVRAASIIRAMTHRPDDGGSMYL